MKMRTLTINSATTPVRLDVPDDDGIPGTSIALWSQSADLLLAGSASECVQGQTTTTIVAPSGSNYATDLLPGESVWALPVTGSGPVTVQLSVGGTRSAP